jgi:ankyrin repeat protein
LRHSSIVKFLESASSKWYHFVPEREHGKLADACLAYLSRYSGSPRKAGNEKDLDTFPFLKYASQNWYLHSRQRGKDDEFSRELSFLRSSSELRHWLQIHDPARPSLQPFEDLTTQSAEPDTGFIYACCCGLTEVARRFLATGTDVNEKGNYMGSAMQAASPKGHVEVVKLLLSYGADVNLRAGSRSSPIVGAPLEVTKLLLDFGANVDAGGEPYDSAIFSACMFGKAEVVKLLMEHGVNLNVVDDDSGSLIQTASAHGHIEVVKLLLAHGADANANEGMSRTPLEIAIDKKDRQLAELLIRAGAKADKDDLAQIGLDVAAEPSAGQQKFMSGQASGQPKRARFMDDPVIEDVD